MNTKKETGEFVFLGGRIYTVNPEQPWAEAVAIKDGRFLHVGSNEEAKAYM